MRPYSAEKLLIETRYSATASGANENSGPVTRWLLFSRPSSRKLDDDGRCPLIERPSPRAVAVSAVTPGWVSSIVYTSRPAKGKERKSTGRITSETVDSSALWLPVRASNTPERLV